MKKKDGCKVDEDLIKRVRSFESRPEFPAKFAVVRVAQGSCGYQAQSPTQKELEPFSTALAGHDAVTSLDPIPGMFLPPKVDLVSLRYAAARIGARYLIVYVANTGHNRGWTWAANLNWLIVPYFVVPSTEVRAAAACEAVLVDVKTNAVYGAASGFKDSRTVYWNLAAKDDSIREECETLTRAALESMARDLARKLDRLK